MWLRTPVLCGPTAEAFIETCTEATKEFKSFLECVDDEAENHLNYIIVCDNIDEDASYPQAAHG
eukprot:11156593-Lingulodinium_polyedra.AAC.1